MKRPSVVESVQEQIIDLIREGCYRPGDQLPTEKELTAALEVGRSSVREALSAMASSGVVDRRAGSGYFLREIKPGAYFDTIVLPSLLTDQTIKYLQEVRLIVEVEAIGLAVTRCNKTDISALEDTLRIMETAPDYGVLGLKCHELIVVAAHNPVLDSLYRVIEAGIWEHVDKVYQSVRGRSEEVAMHRRLVDALESGDRQVARSAMVEHLTEVSAVLDVALAAQRVSRG